MNASIQVIREKLNDFKPEFTTIQASSSQKKEITALAKELQENNIVRDEKNFHFFEKVAFTQYDGGTMNMLDAALDFYLMKERMRSKSKIEKLNALVHYIKVNGTQMFIFIKEGKAKKEEKAAMDFLGNFAKIVLIEIS